MVKTDKIDRRATTPMAFEPARLDEGLMNVIKPESGECVVCGHTGAVKHPTSTAAPGEVERCLYQTCYSDDRNGAARQATYFCAGFSPCARVHRESLHPIGCAAGTITADRCSQPVWNQQLAGATEADHPEWRHGVYCFQHWHKLAKDIEQANKEWAEKGWFTAEKRERVRSLAGS